jgi:hypothetical protein
MSMATTLVDLVEVKDPDQSVGGDWKFAWTRNTVGLCNALIHPVDNRASSRIVPCFHPASILT